MNVVKLFALIVVILVSSLILANPPTPTTSSATTSQPSTAPISKDDVEPALAARIKELIAKMAEQEGSSVEIKPQLLKIGKPAVPFLVETLKHENPYARSNAAEILGQIGDISAYGAIRELLFDYSDPDKSWPRVAALRALVKLDEKNSFENVLKALNNDPDSSHQVKFDALHILCRKYTDKAIEPCLAILNDAESDYLKYFALWIAQYAKDQRVTDTVIKLTRSQNRDLKVAAVSELYYCTGDNVLPRLFELAKDDDQEIRYYAINGIGEHGDAKAIDELRKIANAEKDEGMRITAYGSLLMLKDPGAEDILIAGLSSDKPGVRMGSARYLGQAGVKKAAEHLIRMLNDEHDDNVRIDVARALMQMGDQDGVFDTLSRALFDSNINVCSAAASFLGKSGKQEAIDPLISALLHEPCAYYAARALGDVGDQTAIESLEEIVATSTNPYTRQNARDSIEKIQTRIAAAASRPTTASSPTTLPR